MITRSSHYSDNSIFRTKCIYNQWWRVHLNDLFHITEINLHAPVVPLKSARAAFTCNQWNGTFGAQVPAAYQPTLHVLVSLINNGSAPNRHSPYWNHIGSSLVSYRFSNNSFIGNTSKVRTSVKAKDIALLNDGRQGIFILRISVKGKGEIYLIGSYLQILF